MTTLIRRLTALAAFTVATLAIATSLAWAETRASLLVVLRGENALSFIDPESGKLLRRVAVGEDPHEIAVSSDGKSAFVTNRQGDSISVIDVTSGKELRRFNPGPHSQPHGIFFFDGKVYFTADGYRLAGCFDPANDQVCWLLGLRRNLKDGMLLVKDANTVFTANSGADNVTVMQRTFDQKQQPDWNIKIIPVGKGATAIDLSPDGGELWVAQQLDGGVSILDARSLKVTQTLYVRTRKSNRLKFTPNGKLVLISDHDGGELVVLDAAKRNEIARLKVGPDAASMVVTPDGSRAYVALPLSDAIVIVNLKTLAVMGRISTGKHPESMAWVETK